MLNFLVDFGKVGASIIYTQSDDHLASVVLFNNERKMLLLLMTKINKKDFF